MTIRSSQAHHPGHINVHGGNTNPARHRRGAMYCHATCRPDRLSALSGGRHSRIIRCKSVNSLSQGRCSIGGGQGLGNSHGYRGSLVVVVFVVVEFSPRPGNSVIIP